MPTVDHSSSVPVMNGSKYPISGVIDLLVGLVAWVCFPIWATEWDVVQAVTTWSEHTASDTALTSMVYTVHAFVFIAAVSVRAALVLLQKRWLGVDSQVCLRDKIEILSRHLTEGAEGNGQTVSQDDRLLGRFSKQKLQEHAFRVLPLYRFFVYVTHMTTVTRKKGFLPEQEGCLRTVDYVNTRAVSDQGKLNRELCLNKRAVSERECFAWAGGLCEQDGCLDRKAVSEQNDGKGRLFLNRGTCLNKIDLWRGRLFLNRIAVWTGGRLCLNRGFCLNKTAVWSGRPCLKRRAISELWVPVCTAVSPWTCTYILLRECLM